MLDWLKSYVFITRWSSPIIALIALIYKKFDPANPLDWGGIVLYVGFLSALAAVVMPGFDPNARSVMNTPLFMSLGAIIVRAGRHK